MTRAVPDWASRSGLALFLWVRWLGWRAAARDVLRSPSRLGVLVIVWTALLGWVYVMAYEGMRFVYRTSGLGPFLLSRLWFLFLFVVVILLAVSQLATAYSTLIRAPETRSWMTGPIGARTLARAKWLESSLYSSWAVVAIAIPLCLAYLILMGKPLWLAAYFAGALMVPLTGMITALSSIVLMVWLRWIGRVVIRRELVPVGLLLAGLALFWVIGEQEQETPQDVWFLALQELLPRMQLAMAPWLPSGWAAKALDAGIHDRWIEAGVYVALLWTTLGVCWRLLEHVSAGVLLPVLRAHSLPTGGSPDRGTPARPLRPAGWMRSPVRAALVKDVLLLARDPVQWGQGLIFFGLLGTYFGNIQRLRYLSVEPKFRIGVASLNVACTLLVLGSLAVRFIFPQMSLEARSLWLVRAAPRGLERLMSTKLLLYGTLTVLMIEALLTLSSTQLGVPGAIQWWLAGVGALAAMTLVGLTVGLGAWWIDPAAQDAARVVSSSRGALVLVCMLAYVGCVVAGLVFAWSSWISASAGGLGLASLGLLGVSLLAGYLPVRGGLRKLERLEDIG